VSVRCQSDDSVRRLLGGWLVKASGELIGNRFCHVYEAAYRTYESLAPGNVSFPGFVRLSCLIT
jgi:hypothetical protein